MGISYSEAVAALLKGEPITWSKFGDQKAGAITLETAQKRRLFKFLLGQNSSVLKQPADAVFKGLIESWAAAGDPASDVELGAIADATDSWRLTKIEARGMGGLTSFSGRVFELDIGGENWCLEGQNGSGKSSLANAILWALTGKRFREKDGLIEDFGVREPVLNHVGKSIGTWPPLAAYPAKIAELASPATVWVKLTFCNQAGDEATAFREMNSPVVGNAKITKMIDPRLVAVPQLVETGLIMPARIPTIAFGEKSGSLYEAVKQLTGLDHLADIAESARLLTHGAQAFLKYAKNAGVDTQEFKFGEAISKASKNAAVLGIDISTIKKLGQTDLGNKLRSLSDEASGKAAEHLFNVKDQIAVGLDTEKSDVRSKVKLAIIDAGGIFAQGPKGSATFTAWSAMGNAHNDPLVVALPSALAAAKASLETALSWNTRQAKDRKLRLKALAAQYYIEDNDGGICPLCLAKLVTVEQIALKAELEELKIHSDEAESKLVDACAKIEKQLAAALPQGLATHRASLVAMNPRLAYAETVRELFVNDDPFKSVLVGIAKRAEDVLTAQTANLPVFESSQGQEFAEITPQPANEVLVQLAELSRLHALVAWWSENGQQFRDAWSALVGKKEVDGNYPAGTLGAQTQQLQRAMDNADPADQLAKNFTDAAKASDAWDEIQQEQMLRKAIADSLEDIKSLKDLVGAETALSISALSGRIKEILAKIHLRERLEFADAGLDKKTVNVEGSFSEGMRFEASLVANTSWLRAILWAFVLALREQIVAGLVVNPFPLMLLDDPQVTFDPRNKRKWAEMIATVANRDVSQKDGAQLILTSHEQQFCKFLINEYKLTGQQGMIAGVNAVNDVASVANGYSLQRAYDAAMASNSDQRAHGFIGDTRIYCEDLLKCIMRAEGNDIADMNLTSLQKHLKKLADRHIPPFDREPFTSLRDIIGGGGGAPMNLINDSHHQFDGTIGVAQAIEVKAFWDKKLNAKISQCFQAYAQYEAFGSDPRVFSYHDTVIPFPNGHKGAVKTWVMKNTGIAAAAKSDGRAGDGNVTLTELAETTAIRLHNHDVYQLAMSTLEPVASLGDMLIVSNYAQVTGHSMVVASHAGQLLARRYSLSDLHPDVAVLTAHTLEPHATAQPVIATKEKLTARKIVGTVFASHLNSIPLVNPDAEVVAVADTSNLQKLLNDAKLFKVVGRSAEPIALDGQFLITHDVAFGQSALKRLDGHLVVAFDESGARYFKRLRVQKPFVILESLNPDGTTQAELLSIDENIALPQLKGLLEVVGVLFELPVDGSEKKDKK